MIRLLAVAVVFLTGCTMIKNAPNRFVVERRWVRGTVDADFLGGQRIHRFQPILTEKLVIVGNAIDGLVAYDRDTAHTRWRMDIKDGSEGGAQLVEDILYFGASDGQFYAIQSESGKILWSYPLKAEGIARPLVHGGVVYVLGGNNVAHALNSKTGKLLWTYNRREAGNISVRGGSQPAVAGGLVLIGFSDGALVALNKSSGSIVWETNLNRNKRFRDVDASPIIDGEMAYVSSYDGALYSVNIKDGTIQWTVEDGGYDEVLIVGQSLFFSSSSGQTMALDKLSGKILWKRQNPNGIATAPVLYKGVLMVGEMEGALRFMDARSGELLSEFSPGRGVTSRATVDTKTGEVYFMSLDANLFALRANWKRYEKDWPWE